MKQHVKISFVALILSLCFSTSVLAEDDFQYWSRYAVKVIDTKYVDYTTHLELRVFEDVSDVGLWFASQKLSVAALPYLDLGLNYTYLESESANPISREDEFKYQHRLELEFNPHWSYKGWIKFKNRNRFEFRWLEGQGSDHGRYRQMWGVEVPTPKIRILKSIYANNEIFYDLNKEEFNQNRLIPIGIKFPLVGKSSLQVFYMIQSTKKADWSSNQILGTQINLAF